MPRVPLFPALLVLGAACAGPEAAPRYAVRDSAGVSIAESSSPQWQPGAGWQVDPRPFWEVGSLAGGPAYEFDTVEDAIRLGDGSVVVADFGSRQIRRFGTDGQVIWISGREGDGPGEYNRIRNVERFRGDSILVYDFWIGRATILDSAGQVGRVFRLENTGRSDRIYPVSDSTLIAVFLGIEALERASENGGGLIRIPEPLVRIRPDGAVMDTVVVVPGGESYMIPEAEIRPLFGRRGSQVAVTPDGIYVGTADLMEYRVHTEDGRLQRVIRVPSFDLSLTTDEIEAERATLLNDRSPPWLRSAVAALPAPATRPAYSQLLVDAEGAVWLAPYRGRSEAGIPMAWQVFSAEGDWLGAVAMPERFRVREIGEDYVLGIRVDQDDVEHVQLLRLTRH